MSQQTELAWAAGFFDGEGCAHSYHPKDRKGTIRTDWISYVLNVSQCERTTLERFQKAVNGLGTIRGPYTNKSDNYKTKQRYEWVSSRKVDVFRIADLLQPYLSEPKRKQIASALNMKRRKSMGIVRFTKGDKVITPDGLKGTVRAVETVKTGKPGRPSVKVIVKSKNGVESYSPSSLSFA